MFYICTVLKKKTPTNYMLKKIFYSTFLFCIMSNSSFAQRHEIGVQLGMSNLVGDIGRTNYVLQAPITKNFARFGLPFNANILYRMNFNPYQTLRFNLGYNHIQFSDHKATETYRKNRGLSGANSMFEASAMFEYNFLPINEEQESMLSPYIFGGLGALFAEAPQLVIQNDFRRNAGGEAQTPVNEQDFVTTSKYETVQKMAFNIPFGIGLKYKFNYNWTIFGEFLFRPTFSDSIDYSVIDSKNVKLSYNKDILDGDQKKSLLQSEPYQKVAQQRADDLVKNREIGNTNSKDWVNTVSLGLSYSFGRPPCYCN